MRGAEFAEMFAFAAIAEQRSFAKAAAQLGLGKSTLSQNLRSLEERLGVRLLNRTTRSVSLTEVGARLLARVGPSLVELNAAVHEVAHHRQSPTGLLRLVVQPPVATLLIEPILARFLGNIPASKWTLLSSRCRLISSPKATMPAFVSANRLTAI